MEAGQMMGGIFGLIVAIFMIALGILWFILPFAIFGTKPRLDRIIHELKRQNELLEKQARAKD